MFSRVGKNLLLLLGVLIYSLLFTDSCATSQKDMISLRDQMTGLNNRFKKLEESMGKRIVAEHNSQLASIRERQAEMGAEINKIKKELVSLSKVVDENGLLVKHSIESDFLKHSIAWLCLPKSARVFPLLNHALAKLSLIAIARS